MLAEILRTLHFAADRHRDHRRKGKDASPYINHPIAVAETITRVGGVHDLAVLQAAILHDTVEDTDTTREELAALFGEEVADLVAEVTDDKALRKRERKRLQVEHAPQLSRGAKLVKLADKICNVSDIADNPPADWAPERLRDYVDWSCRVVAGCRGVNEALERRFDEVVARARLAQDA